jgi:hypothetical protein
MLKKLGERGEMGNVSLLRSLSRRRTGPTTIASARKALN